VQALQVSKERCRIRFEVRDSGIGMDEDTLKRLFSPFSQADSSVTRQYGGTGLGLSISKRLVELMGGSIGVDSKPGAGSCFWFELGIAVAQAPLSATPQATGDRHQVALVEPHAASAAMLEDYLRSAGLETLRFDSAATALAALAGNATGRARVDTVLVSSEITDLPAAALVTRLQGERPELACILLDHGVDGLNIDRKPSPDVLQLPLRKQHLLRAVMATGSTTETLPRPMAAASAGQHQGQHELLLVEDNVMNQKVAVHQLNAMGYAVDIAANGAEAIERLEQRHYALILMDCQMPVLDGYEATRRIRRMSGDVARTPIIAMTANAMAGDREQCLAAGMDDYLTKPLLRPQLSAMLAHYLPELPEEEARPPLAAIDENRLQDLFGEDHTLAGEMLALFVEHTGPVLAELDGLCKQAQPALAEIQGLGHRLAGSCMNLGIEALALCGRQVETAARLGDLAQVRVLADECNQAFAQLRLAIADRTRETR
ncbi:MAG: response regulator, partial [Herbaspirillum sp.]|nr:response regulator [Herbaspirillum sp.]